MGIVRRFAANIHDNSAAAMAPGVASLAGLAHLCALLADKDMLSRSEVAGIGADAAEALRALWPKGDAAGCEQVVAQTRKWFGEACAR